MGWKAECRSLVIKGNERGVMKGLMCLTLVRVSSLGPVDPPIHHMY